MADEKEKKEGETEETQKSGGNKTMLIIIIVVVVAIVAVVGILVMSGTLGGGKNATAATQAGKAAASVVPAQSVGDLIPMDTLIVNLNEPGGNRYLKITLKLEVTTSDVTDEMAKKKVPIKSDLIMYLSSLTLSETQSIDAKKKIMINVKNRINAWLSKGKVTRVFFDEFVIQ